MPMISVESRLSKNQRYEDNFDRIDWFILRAWLSSFPLRLILGGSPYLPDPRSEHQRDCIGMRKKRRKQLHRTSPDERDVGFSECGFW